MAFDPILADFERLATRDPGRRLVASPSKSATVADVDGLARAAIRRLETLARTPGSLVVVAAANGPGFLASIVAVRRRGLVPVLLDASAPDEEMSRVIR